MNRPVVGASTSVGGAIAGYIPSMFKWYLFWTYHIPPILMEGLQVLVWIGTLAVISITIYGQTRKFFKK